MLPNQCRPSARMPHLTAIDTHERSTEGSNPRYTQPPYAQLNPDYMDVLP